VASAEFPQLHRGASVSMSVMANRRVSETRTTSTTRDCAIELWDTDRRAWIRHSSTQGPREHGRYRTPIFSNGRT